MKTVSAINRMIGRKVEIVTTGRKRLEGHVATLVQPDGTFTVRQMGTGKAWHLRPEDVQSMRPSRKLPVD